MENRLATSRGVGQALCLEWGTTETLWGSWDRVRNAHWRPRSHRFEARKDTSPDGRKESPHTLETVNSRVVTSGPPAWDHFIFDPLSFLLLCAPYFWKEHRAQRGIGLCLQLFQQSRRSPRVARALGSPSNGAEPVTVGQPEKQTAPGQQGRNSARCQVPEHTWWCAPASSLLYLCSWSA